MRILITENRMVKLYQTLIDRCVSSLVSMGYEEIPTEDWVDPSVFDEADAIESITVTNVVNSDEIYPSFRVFLVTINVNIVLDTYLRNVNLDNLEYHLEDYIKSFTFGKGDKNVKINLVIDNVDLKNKNPQW